MRSDQWGLYMLKNTYPLFISQITRHRKRFYQAALVLLLQAILIPFIPLPLRWLVDLVTEKLGTESTIRPDNWMFWQLHDLSTNQALIVIGLLALLLGALHVILYFLEERLTSQCVRSCVTSTREILFTLALTRKLNFIESQRKVDVLSRMSSDVQNYEAIVASGLIVAARSIPTLLVLTLAMVYLNWEMAIIVLAILPILYLISQILSKLMKKWERVFRADTVHLDQNILQSLQALSILKSLNAEKDTSQALLKDQAKLDHSFMKVRLFFGLFSSNLMMGRYIIRMIVILVGGFLALRGDITLGVLFVFGSYLEMMSQPMSEISNFISRYSKALASVERTEEFYQRLLLHPEVSPTPTDFSSLQLPLRVHNVTHRYSPNTPILFDRWSVTFPKAGLIAVVGKSGVGKTTFLKFLNRLQDPFSGEILQNEQPISAVPLVDLRKEIVSISQEPFFLSQSIRENLILGLSEPPTDSAIMEALRKCQIAPTLASLPLGLETPMGEGGITFSGGQLKRFHLARAFLRDQAQVFILDEPSSGLDPVTAQQVMLELKGYAQSKKLIFFSTHSLEDLQHADQILFFSPHHNPQLGTHDELIKAHPQYAPFVSDFAESERQ